MIKDIPLPKSCRRRISGGVCCINGQVPPLIVSSVAPVRQKEHLTIARKHDMLNAQLELRRTAVENYFQIQMTKQEIDAFSNLGLAHLGDCVYELLCRSYLCAQGEHTVKRLHKDAVSLVTAPKQAQFAEKILPHLTQDEAAYYRRGKNAHSHAAPKSATPQEYAKSTGLETLFGALYLAGKTDRLNELFHMMIDE